MPALAPVSPSGERATWFVYVLSGLGRGASPKGPIRRRALSLEEREREGETTRGVLPPFVQLAVGTKVRLTKNIDLKLGLVKHATGTVYGYEYEDDNIVDPGADGDDAPSYVRVTPVLPEAP